jgi:hypothetical protein
MSAGVYVPLQATFFQDDRIILCSPLAKLVYLQGLCIAKLMGTDGIVTLAQLKRECDGIRSIDRYISELVGHGLWTEVGTNDARRVHNDVTSAREADMIAYATTAWLRHNRSREWIEEYRTARAEDGKRGGRPPKSPSPHDDAPKGNPFESEKGNPFENPENEKGTENLEGRQKEDREKREKTDTTDPTSADNSQEDDPRFSVVVGLLAKRATDRATNVGDRVRYEKGAGKKITEERGDAIRHLLVLRPSATAETIVDLLEHNTAPTPLGARDPEATAKKIDQVADEITESGMFDGIPEPVRDAWVENPAPLPPELLARVRHQEDEQIEEAVAS